MSQYESTGPRPQVVSRWGLYLPTLLLLTLALAWSAFWFYAAKKADERLTQWIASEKNAGRDFECIGMDIGGFPFRIELTCSGVKFNGPDLRVETGPLHTVMQIYSPKLILADIAGPLHIESAGITTSITWKEMRVSVRFGQGLERLSISASEIKAGGVTDNIMIVKSAELHLRTDTSQAAEERAMDFVLKLNEAQIASLDPLFGTQDSGALNLTGTITKVLGLHAGSWQTMLETWRHDAGRILLENARLSKGVFSLEGKGALDIDPAHRLRGDLSVLAKGITPLVSRLVPGNIAQLAGALLDRKDGTPAELPLRLQDGRLSIGPIRTGPVLAPLY